MPALKIEKQFTEDHQVTLRVEADPEQLEQAKRRAAREIAKRTKIPGFRPGKAPYHIIERSVGEAAIFEDAVEHLVNDLYPKAIDEAGIEPYGPGQLEGIPSGDPLVFEFTIPLKAEVELGDYQTISIPYELEPVEEEQLERVMQNMRQQEAVLEPVERPAQPGDEVSIRISGERQDPENNDWISLIREMPAPVVIDPDQEEHEDEWPFSGFARHLVGMSAGEEKDITYTYPEDSQYETLRGAEARFHVKVETVKFRQLPELDDEFAVAHTEFQNIGQLRDEIRTRMEDRAKEEYNQVYGDKILEELVELSTVKFPPQMLQDEVDAMLHDLEHRLEHQQLDIDTYLKSREIDMDALREEMKPAAENRLKRLLVLFEVGKKEDIQVRTEDVQAETINTLSQMYNNMPEQAQKQITREYVNNLTSSVTADLMVRNTLRRLRSIASGMPEEEDKPAASEEELAAEDSLAEDLMGEDQTAEDQAVEDLAVEDLPMDESTEPVDENPPQDEAPEAVDEEEAAAGDRQTGSEE
jgi:trigger factor